MESLKSTCNVQLFNVMHLFIKIIQDFYFKRNQYFVIYNLQALLRMFIKARYDKGTEKVLVASFKNYETFNNLFQSHFGWFFFFRQKSNISNTEIKKNTLKSKHQKCFKSMVDKTQKL